jgi:hypothetical protein
MSFHMKKFYLVILSFGIMTICSGAERIRGTNTHYQQGDWTTFASTRFVRHIALGDRYVYFATTGGITRYDFFSYTWVDPWTVSNGLADDNIFLVAYDVNTGYLWCVSELSISYLEPASQLWKNTYFDEMGLSAKEYVTSMGFGDDRRIYLLTNRDNYYAADNTLANFSSRSRLNDQVAIKWIDEKTTQVDEIPYLHMSDGYMLDVDRRAIDDFQLRHYKVSCSIKDNWNNIWIGTWGLGACRGNLAASRLELLTYGLWDDAVQAMASEGDTFWLGSVQDNEEATAITEWHVPGGTPAYYEDELIAGLDNGDISSILIDGHTVWFGTQNGLTRYDRKKDIWRTITVVDNLVDNHVNDILTDDQFIWVATAGGVSRIVKSTVGTDSLLIQHVQYTALRNLQIFDLDFQFNLLWMATEFGIYVYNCSNDSGGFYKGFQGPANRKIYAVSCFDDEVWFGTEDGIAAFNSATKEWLPPPAKFFKTDIKINRILAARDAVWVATGEGVYKFYRDGNRWVHYTEQDGLASDLVYSVFLAGDDVWFGTARGLTRFYWNSPYRID